MKFKTILKDFINSNPHPRILGRFWASEIFAIQKGYLKPEDFFKNDPIDLSGCRKISSGIAYEEYLSKIFLERGILPEMKDRNKITELKAKLEETLKESKLDELLEINLIPKQEKKILKISDEVSLVVKPDFVFPDKIVETKYVFRWDGEIPERYKPQLEAEFQAFKKPVYLGRFETPFSLKFYKYVPSSKRWENIKKTLLDFYEKIQQI